jgi:hypothetical protein
VEEIKLNKTSFHNKTAHGMFYIMTEKNKTHNGISDTRNKGKILKTHKRNCEFVLESNNGIIPLKS